MADEGGDVLGMFIILQIYLRCKTFILKVEEGPQGKYRRSCLWIFGSLLLV